MKVPNQNGYEVKDNLILEYKFRKRTRTRSQSFCGIFFSYSNVQQNSVLLHNHGA